MFMRIMGVHTFHLTFEAIQGVAAMFLALTILANECDSLSLALALLSLLGEHCQLVHAAMLHNIN
jgi:hypothetical protein